MRILSITAGAAGMYCGSCSRDNALAVELLSRGHNVTLLPLYTPTRTDEVNASASRVLFGGISVYLQQHLALFRMTPRFLDRLWDSPAIIRQFASRSISTDPKLLGEMTVSMLEGERGLLRKEFEKLIDWLADEPLPDIINLPNSLLIGLAGPIRRALQRPVVCTLQGEDLFLGGLVEPYKGQAISLIRRSVQDVDRFLAVSEFYVPVMSTLLDIPPERVLVVPLGINLSGYEPRRGEDDVFRVGYFARIAPEKGLHLLAAAYQQLRLRTAGTRVRLDVAGYLGRAYEGYLEEVRQTLGRAGLGDEFTYRGELDRQGKVSFLRTLDVLSVPATYDEPKGVFLLEAMASSVPVVQPRRGAFTEIVEKTGGGLLVAPDNPEALADGLYTLWQDRVQGRRLGDRGARGVREHYSIARSTDRLVEVYKQLLSSPIGQRGEEARLAAGR